MQARRAARLGAALRACVFAPRVRVGCPGSARAQGQLQVVTCWLAWPAAQLTHLRPAVSPLGAHARRCENDGRTGPGRSTPWRASTSCSSGRRPRTRSASGCRSPRSARSTGDVRPGPCPLLGRQQPRLRTSARIASESPACHASAVQQACSSVRLPLSAVSIQCSPTASAHRAPPSGGAALNPGARRKRGIGLGPDSRRAGRRDLALVAGQPGPRAVQLRHHGQPARAPADRRGALLDDALAHGRVQPRLGPRPDGRLQGAPPARPAAGASSSLPLQACVLAGAARRACWPECSYGQVL